MNEVDVQENLFTDFAVEALVVELRRIRSRVDTLNAELVLLNKRDAALSELIPIFSKAVEALKVRV